MAIAKVILNGNTLIDTTDKTVASSNLLYSNTALGADGEVVTGAVKIGDITIKPENCLSSNTQITPETYIFEDNNLPGRSFTINDFGIIADFKQTNGIKLESGKTYHCIAHVFVKWDDDDSEEYCYADSNFVNSGTNITLGNFNWEGSSGATQTITSITLQRNSSDSYQVRLRIDRNTSASKSGILLPGSFYRITQVDTNGYDTINLVFNSDPRFYGIYQSLAYRSVITSSALGVSEWCNSLSSIMFQQFAGQPFSGNFVFNNVSFISSYAFGSVYINTTGTAPYWSCSFPNCTTIGDGVFYQNKGIEEVYFPQCSSIRTYEFCGCTHLTIASFPICTTIGTSAFTGCQKLKTASFSSCTSIGTYAFSSCSALTTANFPNCTTIGAYAFQGCSVLTTINFPNCTSINSSAFYGCSMLTVASFPSCTMIGGGTFSNCYSLSNISFPKCASIGIMAFYSCSALTVVSFPNCTSISDYAFRFCINLSSFYFMGSSIPSITNTAFTNTTLSFSSYLGYYGSIYVPSSLLASYKTATNWAAYSSRMVGI